MDFRKLKIYKLSIVFAKDIYKLSKELPEEERFGIISQLRRAVISITLNIAGGCGSGSNLEFARFLRISIRSLYEVDSILELSVALGYFKKEDIFELYKQRLVLGKMIAGLLKKLKT